jgi:hypothetical protein
MRYAPFLRSESKVSTVDVLILIPLIPLTPVVITWWLPWESWIPKKVPKYVLGPYLLYAAFAAWHFKLDPFVVILLAIFGSVGLVSAFLDKASEPRP